MSIYLSRDKYRILIFPHPCDNNVNSPYFDGVFVFVTRIALCCVDDNYELGIKVKLFTLYFKNADNHICDVMVLGMPTKQSNAQHLVEYEKQQL